MADTPHPSPLTAPFRSPVTSGYATGLLNIHPTRHHIIATQPRVLLGLGRQLVQYLLIYTILYLLTGKHKIFYSPTSILGGTFSIVQRRACLLPSPLSQSGRADGRAYYNRHLYKDTALKNKNKVKFFSERYFCHICIRQAGPLFRAR